ncbi:MAG: alanine racemase [Anaerolineales bacterium]|jgi:alanine racemase|nr:alanine racemase [Anaerolineales bacterium]
MSIPVRPTQLVVNLSQLRRNAQAIRARVQPAKLLIMLKANAYGHGIDGVAPFIEPDLDYIGVATLEEGVHLRQIGIRKPILVAGGCLPEQLAAYLDYDLTLSVSSPQILDAAQETARAAGRKFKIHLKIDTGMERAAVRWYEAEPFLERSLACRNLEIEGIYSHFANSESLAGDEVLGKERYSYASRQLDRFQQVLAFYEKHGQPPPPLRHMANSGAVLNLPESYLDMVRPGVLFYGIYPEDCLRSVEVETALTWKSRVVYSKVVRAGSPVSYGSLWAPEQDSRVVTIPCGYADGYFRRMTNRARIIVNGRKYPQVGRICMDQCMANLSDDPAEMGDEVILLGRHKDGEQITPADLAGWMGTNTYEVIINIGARVPRVFVEEQ